MSITSNSTEFQKSVLDASSSAFQTFKAEEDKEASLRLERDWPISYTEPSNFLQRMVDENEGLWKGLVLTVRK